MEHEILDLIDRYWKFDNDQTPVSNWHDKQDLLEAVRKALRIHDVVGKSEQLVCKKCDDDGWITEISEGVRTQYLCNCPKAN
jgi:hypothetical protein